MSKIVDYAIGALEAACPKCGAERGEKCRTLATRRTTDIHQARWEKWAVGREWNRRKF